MVGEVASLFGKEGICRMLVLLQDTVVVSDPSLSLLAAASRMTLHLNSAYIVTVILSPVFGFRAQRRALLLAGLRLCTGLKLVQHSFNIPDFIRS